MASAFAAIRAKKRQVVHDHLSLAAVYRENDAADPVEVSIRWHNKIALSGDLDNGGYTEMLEGVNRCVFNIPELTEKNLVLRQGGYVTITETGERLVLGVKEKTKGPIDEIWQVGPR